MNSEEKIAVYFLAILMATLVGLYALKQYAEVLMTKYENGCEMYSPPPAVERPDTTMLQM